MLVRAAVGPSDVPRMHVVHVTNRVAGSLAPEIASRVSALATSYGLAVVRLSAGFLVSIISIMRGCYKDRQTNVTGGSKS